MKYEAGSQQNETARTKAQFTPKKPLPNLPVVVLHTLTPTPLEHFCLKTPGAQGRYLKVEGKLRQYAPSRC